MADTAELADDMITGRRANVMGGLPDDKPPGLHPPLVVIQHYNP